MTAHTPSPGALNAYFADRGRRASKGLAKDRAAANVTHHTRLGGAGKLERLTAKSHRRVARALATAPQVRAFLQIARAAQGNPDDAKDANAVRARRATANRTLRP